MCCLLACRKMPTRHDWPGPELRGDGQCCQLWRSEWRVTITTPDRPKLIHMPTQGTDVLKLHLRAHTSLVKDVADRAITSSHSRTPARTASGWEMLDVTMVPPEVPCYVLPPLLNDAPAFLTFLTVDLAADKPRVKGSVGTGFPTLRPWPEQMDEQDAHDDHQSPQKKQAAHHQPSHAPHHVVSTKPCIMRITSLHCLIVTALLRPRLCHPRLGENEPAHVVIAFLHRCRLQARRNVLDALGHQPSNADVGAFLARPAKYDTGIGAI